jgi:hypothetical protein
MRDGNLLPIHTTVRINNPGVPNEIDPAEVSPVGSAATSSTQYYSSDNNIPGGFPISEDISNENISQVRPPVQSQFSLLQHHLTEGEYDHPHIKSKTCYHQSHDQDQAEESHHYPPPQSYTPKAPQTLFRYKTQQLIPLTEFVSKN